MIHDTTSDQRLLRGAAATLSVTVRDQDGGATDSVGTVTCRVQKADGTDVLAAGSSTTNPTGTGTYARSLTAAQTATLETLLVTWTDGGDSSTTLTTAEVVGGYYFSVAEARAADSSLFRPEKADDTRMLDLRRQVEDEFERICNVAFVPRYRRVRVDGTGTACLVVPDTMIRTVRSVREYVTATAYDTYTAAEIAAIPTSRTGELVRTDGDVWAYGYQNIVIEYEHGFDRPPEPIRQAALRRVGQMLGEAKSAIPANTISFTPDNGVTYRMSTPNYTRTGDVMIDAVLARHSYAIPGMA